MSKDSLTIPMALTDSTELDKSLVCDFNNVDCLDNEGPNCKPGDVLHCMLEEWLSSENGSALSYKVWEYTKELNNGKIIKKLGQVTKSGLRSDVYTDLLRELTRKLP